MSRCRYFNSVPASTASRAAYWLHCIAMSSPSTMSLVPMVWPWPFLKNNIPTAALGNSSPRQRRIQPNKMRRCSCTPPLLPAVASIHAIVFIHSIVMIAKLHNLPSAVLASSGALWRLARPVVHVAEGHRRSWRGCRRWGPRGPPPLPHWSWRSSLQLPRSLVPLQERSARECTGEGGSTLGLTIACLCLEEFDRSNRAGGRKTRTHVHQSIQCNDTACVRYRTAQHNEDFSSQTFSCCLCNDHGYHSEFT